MCVWLADVPAPVFVECGCPSRRLRSHVFLLVAAGFGFGAESFEPVLWAGHGLVDAVRRAVLLEHPENSNCEDGVGDPSVVVVSHVWSAF